MSKDASNNRRRLTRLREADCLDRGSRTIAYDYRSGTAVPGPPAPVYRRCPDCGGTGRVMLLIRCRTCRTCGGRGFLPGNTRSEKVGVWLQEQFDALGRVVVQQQVLLEEG